MNASPSRFDAQRILAGGLVAVQAIGLAILSGDSIIPALLGLVGGGAAALPLRLTLAESRRFWAVSGLGIAFLVRHLTFPIEIEPREEFVMSALFASVAQLCLALQVAVLLIERGTARLPVWLPALGVVALFCAGDLSATIAQRTRRFARKQMTFFRSFQRVRWVRVEEGEPAEETARRVRELQE